MKVPAIVEPGRLRPVRRRLEERQAGSPPATRRVPSLLQGLAALLGLRVPASRGRPRARSRPSERVFYDWCLGFDGFRFKQLAIGEDEPVRADSSTPWWGTAFAALLADPALIRAEIGERLEHRPHQRPGHQGSGSALKWNWPGPPPGVTTMIEKNWLGPVPDHRRAARDPAFRTCARGKPACAGRSTPSTHRGPDGDA